jgi:hypothetical protein
MSLNNSIPTKIMDAFTGDESCVSTRIATLTAFFPAISDTHDQIATAIRHQEKFSNLTNLALNVVT